MVNLANNINFQGSKQVKIFLDKKPEVEFISGNFNSNGFYNRDSINNYFENCYCEVKMPISSSLQGTLDGHSWAYNKEENSLNCLDGSLIVPDKDILERVNYWLTNGKLKTQKENHRTKYNIMKDENGDMAVLSANCNIRKKAYSINLTEFNEKSFGHLESSSYMHSSKMFRSPEHEEVAESAKKILDIRA